MDIDITTFPTPTLWEWVDRVKGWERVLRAEIDRRAVEAVNPPTEPLTMMETIREVEDGVFQFKKKGDKWRDDPPTEGAPPSWDEGGG